MIEAAHELIQYRHLLFTLTWREIKIRYKQTVMGFLWALLMPLMVVAAGILVRKAFSVMSGKPMEYQALVSVMVKALPWAFFAGSIRTASISLISNANLVTKIYFPREVFPFSAVLSQLFDFAVATSFLIVLFVVTGLVVSVYLCWLPLLLLLLVVLTAGWALILSCATLFFRDVKYIVEIVMTFGILFTPVFYDANMFGDWSYVLRLNPVGSILEAINDVVVLNRAPDLSWLLYSVGVAFGSFVLGWSIFEKAEPSFAESI
jgi:lipopolysaccharide transport system permease protein